jgi:hypothetical protein
MLSWLGGCPTTCGRYHSPGCRKDDRKDSGRVVFTLIDAIWVSARSVDQRAEHWSGGGTLNGRTRRCPDGGKNGDSRHYGLLHKLEPSAPADQNE